MGGDRPYTAAELRQREKNQQNPAWLAWLGGMDDALERFLTVDVADMPTDPWSMDGLGHAEQAALIIFPSMDSVLAPENRELADRFQRFIGETYVRRFEGEWMNVPGNSDHMARGFEPAVRQPFSDMYLTVVTQLTAAMHRRSGNQWARVYSRSAATYAEWQAGGRLPLSEWEALRLKKATEFRAPR